MLSSSSKAFKQLSFDVYRYTDLLTDRYAPNVSGAIDLTRQSQDPFKIGFSLDSYSAFGSIAITGLDENSSSQAESVSFASNGFKLTENVYSSIAVLTMNFSDPSSGFVKLSAKSIVNEPILMEVLAASGLRLNFQPESSLVDKLRYTEPGVEIDAGANIFIDKRIFVPQEQDIFTNTEVGRWQAINIGHRIGHWKVRVKRL